MRSITRIVGCSFNTVSKLMLDAGDTAYNFHNQYVRGLNSDRIEADEIWSFCYAKNAHVPDARNAPPEAGNVWTWTAIDPDSKLLVSYRAGGRDTEDAMLFIGDLDQRLIKRIQLTSDGYNAYPEAVSMHFGNNIDYAQLIKSYRFLNHTLIDEDHRYSPPPQETIYKRVVTGDPDPDLISTSIVERHNLTMRMSMRRYTRLTNGFSKRLRHHCASLDLFILYYNFCRPHLSLKNPYQRTPAMAAGLTDRIYDIDWIINMIKSNTTPPRRPKTYRKKPK